MYEFYVWESVGFRIVELDAPSRHRGGVVFFYKGLRSTLCGMNQAKVDLGLL